MFQPTTLGQRPRLQVPRGRRSHRLLRQQCGVAAPPERPRGSAAGRAFQGKGSIFSLGHLPAQVTCLPHGFETVLELQCQ